MPVRRRAPSPTRFVVAAYLGVVLIGSALLALPMATADGSTSVMTALFSAVSAVSITGLSTVDIGTHYSVFGQAVILVLIQIGGYGIVALGTLTALLVRGKLGLRDQMAAQRDMKIFQPGDVRGLLIRIGKLFLLLDTFVVVVLVLRLRYGYGEAWPKALWDGLFLGVSAANQAGLSLYPDSLSRFVGDFWIVGSMSIVIFAGGLGYPVLFELKERWRRPDRWTVHTRLTVWGSVGVLLVAVVAFGLFEWTNPATLGPLSLHDKGVATLAGGIFPTSAGFNTVPTAKITDETMLVQLLVMFIGGGSASTAGGIKITTFLVLAYVMWAELRGEPDVVVGRRRIAEDVQRQALTIALGGIGCVVAATVALTMMTDQSLQRVLFEVVSAFGTVGLSTDLTGELPAAGQFVLIILMFIGRVGTLTFAASLALKQRHRRYRLPEERPLVG